MFLVCILLIMASRFLEQVSEIISNLVLDPLPHRGAFFGTGSGPIFLDNVVCRGTESSLLQCNTNPIRQHNCNHSEDAGVRCEGIQDKQK